MNRTTRPTLMVCVAWALLASPALGQQQLERVEQLTRLGRTDEARSVLSEWWGNGRSDAGRRELQRGLWLRGRLTVDPVQAELDFQRLVVLYPRGPFTAEAVFRLAQSAHAMGDAEAAQRYVRTLVTDYPRSEAREEAERWLDRAGDAPPPSDPPPARADEREERPVDEDREPVADEPATEQEGNYYVQLGAFAEESRAAALFDEVTAAGIEVRIVRVEGSRFVHVRFGRFVERADAVEALERLTDEGITAALVRDERPEQPVGG